MSDRYILEGKKAVPCDDLTTWAKWFEGANRVVEKTNLDESEVSTIFLGLDHAWGDSPPMLFETLVFGGPLDHEMDRYTTWDEAIAGHKAMVEKVDYYVNTPHTTA